MLCSLRSSRLEVWEKEGGTGARGMTTGYGVGGASWTRVPLSCQAVFLDIHQVNDGLRDSKVNVSG